ncbi:amino acid ABC transporter substrate-binding protein [Thioclava sp. F42-5]|uniref:ABC transporter substrate-binding protein n=1 Tax=Thioclava sp. F42-5 TaxID=1973005 RepID=UPI000B53B0A1|nr:ABC transporter substrate-binding protein [Thioclava sp. F42-5]OWY08396.1 amino acid ABC transporter substrate-binding protein [Thioclava sp. F42-5]
MTIKNTLIGATMLALAAAPTLLSAETLKVGSTATGVPFTFLNVESNEVQGMMVDLINAVGEEAGFDPQVEAVDFSSLIPALTSGRIDIISAAMLITESRKKAISFSDPILPYGEGWVVSDDFEGGISADFSELKGKVVGVQQGTVYLERLQKAGNFGELRVYDSLADILAEVQRGRIAAGMGDRPIISYQLSQDRYDGIKLANYDSQYAGDIAIGVRKDDDELMQRINDALAKLKKNGTIDDLAKKWGLL